MNLSSSELDTEARKFEAETLLIETGRSLERMRSALEAERLLEALAIQGSLAAGFPRLSALVGCGGLPVPEGSDLEALQRYRRGALSQLEKARKAYEALTARDWVTAADIDRSLAVRKAWTSWGAGLGTLAILLACWWGWQEARKNTAAAQLNEAKAITALHALQLISMTAWRAGNVQGKPLSALASDMTADCSGIDVRTILPNHPCRQAWVPNAHALFRASIPAPGAPIDAPSEIFFDPWGSPYILEFPEGGKPRIVSAGPDGRLGTPDDIIVDIPYWRLPGEDEGKDRQ